MTLQEAVGILWEELCESALGFGQKNVETEERFCSTFFAFTVGLSFSARTHWRDMAFQTLDALGVWSGTTIRDAHAAVERLWADINTDNEAIGTEEAAK